MLSVVMAIAFQTARSTPDPKAFEQAFAGRIETLARGHNLLIASEWGDTELHALVGEMLGPDAAAGRAKFGGNPVRLSANRLLGVAMILHELYTNAVKYGALSARGGRLELDWRTSGEDVVLTWCESGVQRDTEDVRPGFGQQMMTMTAKADLGGTVDFSWRDDGLFVTIRFPMQNGT